MGAESKTRMLLNRNLLFICWLLLVTINLLSCANKPKEQNNARETIDYIRKIPGKNDSIPKKVAEKGEVLVAYSDCYICHKEDEKSVGPTFKNIAERYPVNKVYVEMLAQKVIRGGSGSWGYPVMDSHPKLSLKDAKVMVTYILSLKK